MKSTINLTKAQQWLLLDTVQEEIQRIINMNNVQYHGRILASYRGIEIQLKALVEDKEQQ